MNPPSQRFTKSVGIFLALMPMLASADVGHSACPTLLTEKECDVYQVTRSQIQSEKESALFERKYTALLKERMQLCSCSTGLEPDTGSQDMLLLRRTRLPHLRATRDKST